MAISSKRREDNEIRGAPSPPPPPQHQPPAGGGYPPPPPDEDNNHNLEKAAVENQCNNFIPEDPQLNNNLLHHNNKRTLASLENHHNIPLKRERLEPLGLDDEAGVPPPAVGCPPLPSGGLEIPPSASSLLLAGGIPPPPSSSLPQHPWKWDSAAAPSQHLSPAAAAATLTPPIYTDLSGTSCKSESNECTFCGDIILERFILQVADRSWHSHCLRCSVCQNQLDSQSSCFLKDEQLYCRSDYVKLFGAKCFKCCRAICPTDWVRKARDQIYHLACFACDACKRQLSTGEEFGIHENRVLCKSHYTEIVDGAQTSSDESGDTESNSKKKTKRMRTTFTEEQIQILQANFQIDSNPDGQDLERIAQITGLSKRVTQVWFQNCRARQKKYINNGKSRHSKFNKAVPMSGLSPIPQDQCPSAATAAAVAAAAAAAQQQLEMHVMYSSFRAQPPAPSTDSNPEDISASSQDSLGFLPSEV